MKFGQTGLFACAVVVGLPLAASAGPNTPVSASGEDFSRPEMSTNYGSVSRSYRGETESISTDVVEDALSSAAGGALPADTVAWINSLQPLGTEFVIGKDTRKRVKKIKQFPNRAIALITFNGGYMCTGWMISENTIATAGHCVYDPGDGFYPTSSYTVYPAYKQKGSGVVKAPYGSCGATDLYTVNGWANDGKDDYDYGAIKLDCSVGKKTGWFGYYWVGKGKRLKKKKVTIAGYPGDKSPTRMWYGKGKAKVIQKRRVFYKIDTFGGQSGSPVYHKKSGCGQCSIAIHAYGTYGSPPFSKFNHGTRITKAVFKNLERWKRK